MCFLCTSDFLVNNLCHSWIMLVETGPYLPNLYRMLSTPVLVWEHSVSFLDKVIQRQILKLQSCLWNCSTWEPHCGSTRAMWAHLGSLGGAWWGYVLWYRLRSNRKNTNKRRHEITVTDICTCCFISCTHKRCGETALYAQLMLFCLIVLYLICRAVVDTRTDCERMS